MTVAEYSLKRTHFQILGFGFILCFDSFLHTFTILPIRFALAIYRMFTNIFTGADLPQSQKADILRVSLLAISIFILVPLTDASKIYHSIRGQETIKLYVIFNALEVCAAATNERMEGADILSDCGQTLLVFRTRHPRLCLLTFNSTTSFKKGACFIQNPPAFHLFLHRYSIYQ